MIHFSYIGQNNKEEILNSYFGIHSKHNVKGSKININKILNNMNNLCHKYNYDYFKSHQYHTYFSKSYVDRLYDEINNKVKFPSLIKKAVNEQCCINALYSLLYENIGNSPSGATLNYKQKIIPRDVLKYNSVDKGSRFLVDASGVYIREKYHEKYTIDVYMSEFYYNLLSGKFNCIFNEVDKLNMQLKDRNSNIAIYDSVRDLLTLYYNSSHDLYKRIEPNDINNLNKIPNLNNGVESLLYAYHANRFSAIDIFLFVEDFTIPYIVLETGTSDKCQDAFKELHIIKPDDEYSSSEVYEYFFSNL